MTKHQLAAVVLGCIAIATIAAAGVHRPVDARDPALATREGKLFRGSRAFSGLLVERFPSGALYRESQYEAGLLEGRTKVYALNGRMIEWENFHAGRKEGAQQGWFAEGPRRYEAHFRNGVLDGPQTEWHLNGEVFRRQVFANGVETDKKILYQGGEIFTNYAKREGRVYGLDGGALCLEPPKREGER